MDTTTLAIIALVISGLSALGTVVSTVIALRTQRELKLEKLQALQLGDFSDTVRFVFSIGNSSPKPIAITEIRCIWGKTKPNKRNSSNINHIVFDPEDGQPSIQSPIILNSGKHRTLIILKDQLANLLWQVGARGQVAIALLLIDGSQVAHSLTKHHLNIIPTDAKYEWEQDSVGGATDKRVRTS